MRYEYLSGGEVKAIVDTEFPEIEFHYLQSTLGVEVWRVATDQTPVSYESEPPLAKAKRMKTEELNALCAADLVGGVFSAALGDMHKYDSDIVDQLNFTQALILSLFSWLEWREKMAAWVASHEEHEDPPVETPVPYRIWNTDGVTKGWYGHKCLQFVQVLKDGATAKATSLFRCSQLKAMVAACSTVDEVNSISWGGTPNG
jgi:hypothetical protein